MLLIMLFKNLIQASACLRGRSASTCYYIAKEIQILVPGYGFDKTFNIMGTLHIELVLDDIFAQMIKGSGLSDVLNIADLSVENAGNVLSNASGNTWTRYLTCK